MDAESAEREEYATDAEQWQRMACARYEDAVVAARELLGPGWLPAQVVFLTVDDLLRRPEDQNALMRNLGAWFCSAGPDDPEVKALWDAISDLRDLLRSLLGSAGASAVLSEARPMYLSPEMRGLPPSEILSACIDKRRNGYDRQNTQPAERDEDVQRTISQALRKAGYRVLSTSRRRRRCVHCGKWSAGGDGVDMDVSELLVRHPEWPPAVWARIEVNGARTSLSPEQQELLRVGAIGIARCEADAFGICDMASGYMRTYDPYVTEAET